MLFSAQQLRRRQLFVSWHVFRRVQIWPAGISAALGMQGYRCLGGKESSAMFAAIWQTSHDIGTEGCRRKHKNSFMLFLPHSAWFSSCFYIYTDFVLLCISQQNLFYPFLLCGSVRAPCCVICIESHYWTHSLDGLSAPHTQSGWPCHAALPWRGSVTVYGHTGSSDVCSRAPGACRQVVFK